ncbi:multiple sugar transport system permease protein [Halobacillus dabanensis]|uniref:Multiple sugar transport system permease protein n=1 Tax=Halobacillus dabanensis TaxID=240302 RepID=A0A1I3RXD6_HALDA|nr:sugar ABC transporter permease [Halobacillus dabanensis]SFJ51065.1 multiple sugar transport system permease protein [Halobacillus dabanensis]
MFAGKIDKSRYGYLFIAPFFLVFFIFDLGPILYSFYLSFTDWSGFDTPSFVGLANYERLLQDTLFFKSIYNTLVIWILSIIPQLTIALTLALILHEKFIRGKHLFHAIFYFPNMVTPVTMGVLFALIFDWQNGSANKIIMALGIVDDPVNWFNSPFLAQLIVASILMWQWFGFNMLVFLAGLQSIPEDLYEAAEIDGANKFQTAIKITLPLLRPVLIFTMITSVIGGMQIFDQPLMIGKGPENSTLTMVMHLYEAAFVRYEYGYGAAIAYGIFVLIAVATAFSMWMTKIREKKEGVS